MNTSFLTRTSTLTLLASAMMTLGSYAQSPSDKPTVSGKFLGNGKDGKIQYLVVQNTDPFSDKPAIQLIFTEKDPSQSKKPDWDAGFKKFGSALVVSTHQDGSVFGCEVAHSEHQKSPFSSVGRVTIKDMKVTDTQVSGVLTTGGPGDFFGQTWDVELTFSAPLPKGAFTAVTKPEPAPAKEEESAKAKASGPMVPLSKLALPVGALDVEYKEAVEQISFRSDSSVTAVSKDFAAKLKAKGWTDAPGGLMGKTNTMMRRKLNGAALTIMIQSADKGCSVKIFTEGLDWSDTPAASAPAATTQVKDIEAEANRLLNQALKNLPKF